jgi:hypothetical protein
MSVLDLLDRPIAYHRVFAKLTGSVKAAVMLSQAVYWQKRAKQQDGWWYKTAEEWEEETGLTRHEQDSARKACEKYLKSDLRSVPATLHWKVDEDVLSADLLGEIGQTSLPKSGKQERGKAANIKRNAETTTETTSEKGGGLSEKEIQQANAKVDAMIANSKKVKYQNRDKIPEPYLDFADLYNELTKQEPTKRSIMDWFGTFEDWKSEGLQSEHIRAAWQYANRPEGGFPVGRPGSLTTTAVAMKSKMLAKPATTSEPERDPFEAIKKLAAQQGAQS